MATRAHSVPSCTSSPGIDPVTSPKSPTRRGILAGGALAATIPAIGLAAPAERSWDRLRHAYEAAYAAVEHYEAAAYRPANARVDQLAGPMPPTSIELVAKNGQRSTLRMGYEHEFPPFPLIYGPAVKLQHDYDAWRERKRAAEHRFGIATIYERLDALDDALDAARTRLMEEPAPDGAALAYKVKLAMERDALIDLDRQALTADAARLAA